MEFFDLHCDTIYESIKRNVNIFKNDKLHISVERGSEITKWSQCFAIWLPDSLNNNRAFFLFNQCIKLFKDIKLKTKDSNLTPLLTIEGASKIINNLFNIDFLKKIGVRALTLTWNASTPLGDGIGVKNPKGLTDFGAKCLQQLEKNNIYVDVSHASEPLFWDIVEHSTKPIIASHSNAYSICNHKRNLNDNQIIAIKNSHGIIGLTLCDEFLKSGGKSKFIDIEKHIEHFLLLGGKDFLSIGTDFDGTTVVDSIYGIQDIFKLYNYFLRRNYSETLLRKIFFENANNFFSK